MPYRLKHPDHPRAWVCAGCGHWDHEENAQCPRGWTQYGYCLDNHRKVLLAWCQVCAVVSEWEHYEEPNTPGLIHLWDRLQHLRSVKIERPHAIKPPELKWRRDVHRNHR